MSIYTPTPLEAARAMRDKAVLQMDATWGTDVVQTLVSPATAAKFTAVCLRRDLAIETGDDKGAIDAMTVEVRGLQKMDEEARTAGHVPLKIDRSWATRGSDGSPWVFVQSEDDARSAARSGRFKGYQIWSLPEVIRILEQNSLTAVLDAKRLFPEAAVTQVKPPVDWTRGDEVGL